MSRKNKLVIITPLFNEAEYISEMLESLLSQTYTDFSLVISENYSTDDTAEIVGDKIRGLSNTLVIRPERHLAGIEHGIFLYNHVRNHCSDYSHVLFLGGHDVVSANFVDSLLAAVAENPASSIIYTDTFRINHKGQVLEHYSNSLNTRGLRREFVPFVVLFGLEHNIMFSGIQRMDVFQSIGPRFTCCAADHLLLCEAASKGPITYCPGAALFLRDSPSYRPGYKYYVEKHIPAEQRQRGCVYDFALQISWLISLLEQCSGGLVGEAMEQPVKANYFLAAIQLYFSRYAEVAEGFPDSANLLSSELFHRVQNNDLSGVLEELWTILR